MNAFSTELLCINFIISAQYAKISFLRMNEIRQLEDEEELLSVKALFKPPSLYPSPFAQPLSLKPGVKIPLSSK